MPNPIKVLFIEDTVNDCDLLVEHLREHNYQPEYERVVSESEMVSALNKSRFDIILCDHNLPNFDIFSALELSKKMAPKSPFIVVSGSVSEAIAVKALKAGAKDYVLKNNISRLIPAIERELIESQSHLVYLRVEAELKKKELELRQAQKLEAVGQLAGGVAHDFNNMLSVILMQTEEAIEFYNERPELKNSADLVYKSLEEIKKAGGRAANLTRKLLAFSRKQVIQSKVIDINEMVRDMEKMLSRVIEENVALILELDPETKNVKADPGHIEQIMMNLIVNSRDAMSNGGKVTITTRNSFLTEETTLKINSKAGPYTLLQIADTGCGMSEETQKHMFDPFFTTKEVGKGTGLGLSTVYGIVKQNKGLIFVESTPGVGTTFKIYLPQSDERAEAQPVSALQAAPIAGGETILLAEDEDNLRMLVCKLLRKSGYKVLEARDGAEALKIIETYQSPIHLVLTDVVMPIMGGRELSQKAKEINFNSRFLFLSGYTEDVLLQQGIDSGQSFFLEKPYTVKALLQKVQSILELDR